MTSQADDNGFMTDERLPWLETVEPDDHGSGNAGRIIALALLGLAVLAGVIFGIYQLQKPHKAGGDGQLIAAQEGDYKVKPDDPGGLKVAGEGDAAIATSAGTNTSAAIDLRAVPEAPITGHRTGATPAAGATATGKPAVSAEVPAASAPLHAARPVTAPAASVPGAGSGGAVVQLGAFPTEAAANAAWSAVAKRFSYVATLGKSIQAATVNGRTVHRLRVNAGSANAAADICGRLKVAGESCFVTN